MKRLRRVLFWSHLAVGVGLGLVVAIMAATGAAMALEPQIKESAQRPTGTVAAPAGAARLPVDELLRRVAAARAGAAVTAVTVAADPSAAVLVSLGRDTGAHVDPYSGEVRELAGDRTRRAFAMLVRWHRYLGAEDEGRDLGRAITGIANAGFLFLAVSGLVLWWPRRWSLGAMRASLWFRRGLSGRARDWNWHNTLGFWSLAVILVITASGLMISYRPVSNLVFRLAGETPPPPGPPATVPVPAPPAGARRVPLEEVLAQARERTPGWSSMTVRLGGGRGGRGERAPQALTVSVKAPGAGPRFASIQLAFDPFSGRLLNEDRFADQSAGRRARSWLRFLHTGEALGLPGQLLAGLVSLGTLVLVFTGAAMALRRLRARLRAAGSALPDGAVAPASAPPALSVDALQIRGRPDR